MKTSTLVLFIFLFTGIAVHAQSRKQNLQAGIFVSPELISNSLFTIGMKPASYPPQQVYAFSSGLTLRQKIAKRLYLASGLGLGIRKTKNVGPFYSIPGSKEEGWNCLPTDLSNSSSLFLLELQVPLTLQIYLLKDKLYINPGAEWNYAIYSKLKATFPGTDIGSGDIKYEKASIFNGMDMAVQLGIGYRFTGFNKSIMSVEPYAKMYNYISQLHKDEFIFGMKVSWFFGKNS